MNVTTVSARGEAEIDFNLARFSISLQADGENGFSANEKLKGQVELLNKTLEEVIANHEMKVVKNSVYSNTSVAPFYKYNDVTKVNDVSGYRAVYSRSFQTDSMDKINIVYDKLAAMANDQMRVNSPTFHLRSFEKLNKKALRDAWKKVMSRFEDECKIFELEASNYQLGSWEVNYSDSNRGSVRPMMAMAVVEAPSRGSEPIEISLGKAKVIVNLSATFQSKNG
jgi:uncharacterized protein YggE